MITGIIKSFSYTSKGAQVKYTVNPEELGDYTPKEISLKVDRKPSDTLNMMVRSLLSHALIVSGLDTDFTEDDIKKRSIADNIKHKGYQVKSFTISGDNEKEAIQFNLTLLTQKGAETEIKTPKIFINLDIAKYEYVKHLRDDLANVFEEIYSFIDGEAYGQLELALEESDEGYL